MEEVDLAAVLAVTVVSSDAHGVVPRRRAVAPHGLTPPPRQWFHRRR
ncbi:MAG TPA: hypothetical protein VFY02_05555 [Gaiellaceae bacterium]|nr:hypothetical protein [Gaiellaceae bacterium]